MGMNAEYFKSLVKQLIETEKSKLKNAGSNTESDRLYNQLLGAERIIQAFNKTLGQTLGEIDVDE